MNVGALRALALDRSLSLLGVDAIVTRPFPDDTPIVTRGIWMTQIPEEVPGSFEFQRKGASRVLVLSRSEVPTIPRSTFIVAPEKTGDTPQRWQVDGIERTDAEQVRVLVVPSPDPRA